MCRLEGRRPVPELVHLQGKCVLVTGSTTGIGEATLRLCVAAGARVMMHGRDARRASRLARELGRRVRISLGNLAEPAACDRLIRATIRAFGRLDGLVNNAAVTTRSDLETTDAPTFDRIIAINLRAPLLLIRAALPHFRRQGNGVVVNIGSVNALCGENQLLAYSVAKGGLMTLTRNLADAHVKENIRFNQQSCGMQVSPDGSPSKTVRTRKRGSTNWLNPPGSCDGK